MNETANWWVVCIEYVAGPFTKAAAANRLTDITRNAHGFGCRRDHHLVQSDTEPEPSYPPGPPTIPAGN